MTVIAYLTQKLIARCCGACEQRAPNALPAAIVIVADHYDNPRVEFGNVVHVHLCEPKHGSDFPRFGIDTMNDAICAGKSEESCEI